MSRSYQQFPECFPHMAEVDPYYWDHVANAGKERIGQPQPAVSVIESAPDFGPDPWGDDDARILEARCTC